MLTSAKVLKNESRCSIKIIQLLWDTYMTHSYYTSFERSRYTYGTSSWVLEVQFLITGTKFKTIKVLKVLKQYFYYFKLLPDEDVPLFPRPKCTWSFSIDIVTFRLWIGISLNIFSRRESYNICKMSNLTQTMTKSKCIADACNLVEQ